MQTLTPNAYAPPHPYTPGTRKLKILLISHTCQSRTEGQPKCHALAALPDIDLHLLTPKRWHLYGQWRDAQPPLNAQFQFTIAPVRRPWMGPAQDFLHAYPQLPRLLQEFQPDIIDLWEEPWSCVSWQACRLRKKFATHAKIVSETEQNIAKHLPFPFEYFRNYTLRHADFLVGRSAEAVRHIRAKGYAGPAEVVPNAVDTTLFRPLDRTQCRQKLLEELHTLRPTNSSPGIAIPGSTPSTTHDSHSLLDTPDLFLLGYAGRLVPEKGLFHIVEALAQTPANVHALFIGSGPLESQLRQRAADLNLADRLHILPPKPLEQLPSIFNSLDVFILPSLTTPRWKEQFGRVLIEAAACATPVIGSNSGAIPDVIADSGLIVPEANTPALANAINQLQQNPTLRTQLGQAGLRNAATLFTWQKVAQRMATIYQHTAGLTR